MSLLALYGASLLLCMSWLASNHYPPWVAAHSELLAALAAALLLLSATVGSRTSGLRIPRAAMFLGVLAVVPLAQAVAGHVVFFGDAWIAALYVMCAACCVVASTEMASRPASQWPVLFAAVLLSGAIASSWIAWVQKFQLDAGFLGLYVIGVKPGHAPYANLAQPNQLATLLGLGMAGVFCLFETRKVSKGVALATAGWLAITMGLTLSRTPLLLFLAAGATLWMGGQRLRLRTATSVVAVLAVVWGASFLLLPTLSEVLGLSSGGALAGRAQAGPRLVIWSQLWDAVWLRPLTGFGWNQVSMAQVAVAEAHPLSRMTEHSHNLVLDLLLWNGVPLAILAIGVACWWLAGRVRRLRSVTGVFGLLAVSLLLAHSMVEFPLDYLYFLVPFGIALGLVEVDGEKHREPRIAQRFAGGAIAMVFGLIALGAWDYWRVEEAYRDMRFTVARVGRPMVTQPPPPPTTQFTQLAAFHTFSLMPPRPGMSQDELAWMRNVAHRYGYAPSLYRYALAQALNGDQAGARLTMLQLKQLHGDVRYLEGKRELEELVGGEPKFFEQLRLP